MSYEQLRFFKVVWRHYSGEVENVYVILQHIYSGNGVPNFIRITRVSLDLLQKYFYLFFSGHTVILLISLHSPFHLYILLKETSWYLVWQLFFAHFRLMERWHAAASVWTVLPGAVWRPIRARFTTHQSATGRRSLHRRRNLQPQLPSTPRKCLTRYECLPAVYQYV